MKPSNASHKVSIPGFLKFVNRPAHFFDDCAKRYGDDYTVRFPDRQAFTFISHPQSMETLLTAPPETFNFHEGMKMFGHAIRDRSLIRLDGDAHLSHRKLLKPPFHGRRMQVYGEFICHETEKMMSSWQIEQSFNVLPPIHEVTFDILLNVLLGSQGDVCDQLRQNGHKLVGFANSSPMIFHVFVPWLQKDLGSWSVWGRFVRLRAEFDRLLSAEIARRRENPDPEATDILSMLVEARYEDGQLMSERELCHEILTMLMTGYDIVSTNLLWAIYWIHRIPEVKAYLLEEFNTISDPLDTKAISQLPYLTAVCKETLRLHPILGFSRVTRIPFKIGDREYPVGSQIMGNIYSAQRRQEVYSQPTEFKPERFLNNRYSLYEYLPFGGGNRICIAMAFTHFQMKLMLFTVLSQYQLKLADAKSLHLHTVRRASGMIPAQDVRLQVTARRDRALPLPTLENVPVATHLS